MFDNSIPKKVAEIEAACREMQFEMSCDSELGSLLRTLVASKPNGRFLELGTGAGASTAWMLDRMIPSSELTSVEVEPELIAVAQRVLGEDPRLKLIQSDAAEVLSQLQNSKFDLIFADTWPGKLTHFEAAISLLTQGGFYVVDDLLPQPTGHQTAVDELCTRLYADERLSITRLDWSTGVIVGVRR